jgi:hypothetical protein
MLESRSVKLEQTLAVIFRLGSYSTGSIFPLATGDDPAGLPALEPRRTRVRLAQKCQLSTAY